MGQEDLIIDHKVEEFFFHQIRQACFNQNLESSPHTEFYLVQLLSHFSHREGMVALSQNRERPLAIQYLESLQSQSEDRIPLLKGLGDFILYVSGFFQESLERRGMELSYYFSLGENAYRNLHALSDQNQILEAFQETFAELATKFPAYVEVLWEISENTHMKRDSGLLRLYERYLSTGSKRLLNKLHQEGFFPQITPSSPTKH